MPAETKLLMITPTPPPIHGVTVYGECLLNSSLRESFDLRHLDTSDHRSLDNLGRFDLQNVLLALRQVLCLVWLCLRWKPDVVYLPVATTPLAYVRDGLLILGASLSSRPRIVVHLHGGTYFRSDFYANANPILRWFVEITCKRVDTAIVLSPAFRSVFDGLVERVAVLPNGVPDDRSEECGTRGEGTPVVVGFLGNLFRSKGVGELIDAARTVVEKGYHVEFQLAGSWWVQDSGFREEMLTFLRTHSLERHVHLRGVLAGKEKREFLRTIDILVVPGGNPEGMPLAILEAMAWGKPVIAARGTGAIEEMIEEGRTGLFVSPRSATDLVQAICFLIDNPGIRVAMGRQGRRRFEERYTMTRNIEALTEILRATKPRY